MLTVLNVFGTRPEAIKMAPVIMELSKHSNRVRSMICSVAQHREMLDQVLSIFEIEPDYDLNLMQPDQSLSQLTASLFAGLDPVVSEIKPDWILAQGDTTTVFVAAMVAFYRGIAFGHVEAGLRTGDRARPFPEEINRRLADLVATAYFAPTENARPALTLSVNNLLVAVPYTLTAYRGAREVGWQLALLKSEREPITVQFNRFAATRYRFEREGIRYVEVKTLHCPEEHKDQVRWSQALICVDRPN